MIDADNLDCRTIFNQGTRFFFPTKEFLCNSLSVSLAAFTAPPDLCFERTIKGDEGARKRKRKNSFAERISEKFVRSLKSNNKKKLTHKVSHIHIFDTAIQSVVSPLLSLSIRWEMGTWK